MIGAHTPEFGFERNLDNVIARSREFGVDYPIAVDSDYGVWSTFANHFWPAVYIADTDGRIRYHHFGEGECAMIEMVVQQLLVEAGADGFDSDLVSVDPMGFEVPADWRTLRTPETYLGVDSGTSLTLADLPRFNQPHAYPRPHRLGLNQWTPSGTWTLASHAAVSGEAGSRIAFQFQARDVHLVMSPTRRGDSVPFRVLLDGERRAPPTAATSTMRATGRSPTSACISSSASPVPWTSGASRSSFRSVAMPPSASLSGSHRRVMAARAAAGSAVRYRTSRPASA